MTPPVFHPTRTTVLWKLTSLKPSTVWMHLNRDYAMLQVYSDHIGKIGRYMRPSEYRFPCPTTNTVGGVIDLFARIQILTSEIEPQP